LLWAPLSERHKKIVGVIVRMWLHQPLEAARIMAASLAGADLRLITRKYGKPTIEKAAAQDHA
jgi:hypothetical protein